MEEKKRRPLQSPKNGVVVTDTTETDDTNLAKGKDITKVLTHFRYKVGTSLDVALATGILRNSVTYYIRDLEDMGLLQAIYVAPDKHTHYLAKHYSADPKMWRTEPNDAQCSLFGKEEVLCL